MPWKSAIVIILTAISQASAMDIYDQDQAALEIAHQYRLTRDQAIFLFAIRDHENGKKAKKEFGMERVEIINDPIRRYFNHGCRCANLIKKFCPDTKTETIKRFNHGFEEGKIRYPGYAEDPLWYKKVKRKMRNYRDIAY